MIGILWEDQYLLVVNKPAGMTVNRSETTKREYTAQEWVEDKYTNKPMAEEAEQNKDFIERAGIVHRLDKETSGCLIIAKTPEVFCVLQRQFKNREVGKEYIALVYGKVEPKEGTIKVPLARSRSDRQKWRVAAGGKMAETEYKVVKQLSVLGCQFSDYGRPVVCLSETEKQKTGKPISDNRKQKTDNRKIEYLTLLRIFPKTGRTHQIRVHLKYFGHPIVGDEKYAGKKRAERDKKLFPRLFLHAAKISFMHPVNHRRITVESPLPRELSVIAR